MLRWLGVLALAACSSAASPGAAGDDAPPAASGGPVVLELFTSQGCSSCPPADRWLATLAAGDVVAGRPVIPLAFHVDYWNRLGWADPFSSPAWSARQAAYGDTYTPQIVVAGGADAVGSKRRAVERLIAATPPTAYLDAVVTRDGDRVTVRTTPPAGTTALAAIVSDRHLTEVTSGENAGAELVDAHVVRALVTVHDTVTVDLDPAWGPVRVVVLAQAADGAIVAARAL